MAQHNEPEVLLSTTAAPKVLASVANVSVEAAREALKRGLRLQRSEYLSYLKQQRVLIERNLQKQLERRVKTTKAPQPATTSIDTKIQELAKEMELLKLQVSKADSSLQVRAVQLADTLDCIKAQAVEGKESDAENQTPDKAAAESATPDVNSTCGDLPAVAQLDVSLDEGPLTVVEYHSDEDSDEPNESIAASGSTFRERLESFYTEYNPSKVKNVDRLLETYRGREQDLMIKLHQRYNVPFSRTNGAPPPPPSNVVVTPVPVTTPNDQEQKRLRRRSKSFARGMFRAVKTVFSMKKDTPSSRESGRSPRASSQDRSNSGSVWKDNISRWLKRKPEEGRADPQTPEQKACLDEVRTLRLEVQRYQEQEACLKMEAQTLRDVVRERDACHSAETQSLKEVVTAMHDEMKRICEENDALKLQMCEIRKNDDTKDA